MFNILYITNYHFFCFPRARDGLLEVFYLSSLKY